MPRGRKRKVPLEEAAESAEESMDEPMEAQPEVAIEQPEGGEAEGEAGETAEGEAETSAEPADTTEDAQPAEDEDLEPGEVAFESNECPPVEELKKIKAAAQVDMTRLDVLICGKCHNAFHLVEELVEHKEGCGGNSTIISATTKSDNKPQVWAFVLYKAYKMRESGDTKDANERSWALYQMWSALDEHLKATWVAAGKSLMGLQQYAIPSKKPTPRHHMHAAQISATEQHKQTLLQLQKELEDDEPSPVVTSRKLTKEVRKVIKHIDDDTHTPEVRKRAGLNQVWRKSSRQGADETETELFTVEKIVAKRANPKLKSAEYLVRWAGLPSDQNSWEHASNLLTCKPIVEEFERNLARQKARKAAEAARLEKTAIQNAGGRPVRSSALKAMDQVKEWVGGKEVEEEEEYQVVTTGLKKRVMTTTPNKTQQVIMANSRGVLKFDQSNMANLSSGVYIISDQSGLVKVEDHSGKLASCIDESAGTPVVNNRTMMINETEVRKISGNKYATFRKDSQIRKENNAALGQKRAMTSTPKPAQRTIPQRGRGGGLANRQNSQAILGRSGGQQKLMRIISEDDSVLTSEDGSMNITGSMLGEDGNETMVEEGDLGVADVDDDGLMRMAISPGGSLHQIVNQRPKQQLVQEQHIAQGTEMIQIEGEDGAIYSLTPEQQQMLLQNGTVTMDTKQEALEENTEMVIENGQIVRRMIGGGADAEGAEEGTLMLAGNNMEDVKVEQDGEGEDDNVLTLQSAVQEALGPRITFTTDEGSVDCAVVSADPLQPGGTTRTVLLQSLDGTLFQTDIDEEQFQSLGFELK